MNETSTDTRIAAHDALVPYLQHAWKVWGDQLLQWQVQKMPGREPVSVEEDLFSLARDYRDRDAFVDMAKATLVRDDMIELPFEVVKFGEMPGGPPHATMWWRERKNNKSTDHFIAFGLDPDGDQWYVALDDTDDWVLIPWRDISPQVIAHYVHHFLTKLRGY